MFVPRRVPLRLTAISRLYAVPLRSHVDTRWSAVQFNTGRVGGIGSQRASFWSKGSDPSGHAQGQGQGHSYQQG
jgi:hypothetical protein